MLRSRRLALCTLATACALWMIVAGTAMADAPAADDTRDIMFGHQNVELGIDREVIKVGEELGKFHRIRLRVLGHDVHVNALRIVFVDGTKMDVTLDTDIPANAYSRWFDVDGAKFLHEIQLTYRAR